MRNPERIPEMLDAVRVLWESNPDWRLGQLVDNMAYASQHEIYYVEDEMMLFQLQSAARKAVANVDPIPEVSLD